jgi:hypothetical protein
MPLWPFHRRQASYAPPPAPVLFDGTFAWESPAHSQRRRDRVQDAERDVQAKVAARSEYHPRARAAFDGVIAGLTAGWHLEDDGEHTRALGRLRQMQTDAAVARASTRARLREAKDARRVAWLNWREGYLRLGGEPPDELCEPLEPPSPLPDDPGMPGPRMIDPPAGAHRPSDGVDNEWMMPHPDDPEPEPDDPDDPAGRHPRSEED